MREVIKATLQKWIDQHNQKEQQINDLGEYDCFLDNDLLVVGKFLKEISLSLDDMELLGLVTKLEMYLDQKYHREAEFQNERVFKELQKKEFSKKVMAICCKYFYIEPVFNVDMSKYQTAIEEASGNCLDQAVISRLTRYIDEKNILKTVYDEVTRNLINEFFRKGALPEMEDVESAFQIQMLDIYRKADTHVFNTLAKYTSI